MDVLSRLSEGHTLSLLRGETKHLLSHVWQDRMTFTSFAAQEPPSRPKGRSTTIRGRHRTWRSSGRVRPIQD